jgi:hypothetical protein
MLHHVQDLRRVWGVDGRGSVPSQNAAAPNRQ